MCFVILCIKFILKKEDKRKNKSIKEAWLSLKAYLLSLFD